MNEDRIQQDRHLFALIAEGDEVSFRELFRHYSHQMLPFLIKLTKSEAQAEEIVQEVFLRIWIKREQLTEIDNPQGWMFRIASNLAYTWLRKMVVEKEVIKNHNRSRREEGSVVEESLHFREIKALMEQAIQKMPAQRRRIYVMNRTEGLKAAEIADELGLSVSTVKNQLLTASKFIREFIEKHGHGLIVAAWLLIN